MSEDAVATPSARPRVPHELYPFEGRRLDLDGLSYHYLDEGTSSAEEAAAATPVLMVHGNPTWSFYYRDLVRALSPTRRCIVPDHIGCGLSDKPGDDRYTYTLARRVADLAALMDHLRLATVDVVAHDWGGMIASAWLLDHLPQVRRVVLMNTAAFTMPGSKKLPRALWLARDTRLGAFVVRGFNAFSRGATHMAVTQRKLPKAVRDAYAAPYDSWANRIATLRFVQDIPLDARDASYAIVADTEARLGQLSDTPVLLPWGMKDFVFDHHFLERFVALVPHAEVHRYPEAGHYVLEDAADALIPLIAEFLDRPDARPSQNPS